MVQDFIAEINKKKCTNVQSVIFRTSAEVCATNGKASAANAVSGKSVICTIFFLQPCLFMKEFDNSEDKF